MTRRRGFIAAAASARVIALGLLLGGCGDANNALPDSHRPPDLGTPQPDAGPAEQGGPDRGTSDGPTADRSGMEAGPDIGPLGTDKCAGAQPVTLTAGKATINGSTAGATDEFPTLKCGQYTALDGPQVYYTLQVPAGKSYRFKLTPTFSAYLYVFSMSGGCSASAIESYCASGGPTGDVLGPVGAGATKSLVFSPVNAETYGIAVDSTSSTSSGAFVLEIEEFTPPPNGTCAGAEPVTLGGDGKAVVTGNTSGTKNQFATLECGGYDAMVGPQLYYKLSMAAGKAYKLTLTPTFYAYLYVFSSAAGCSLAGIEADCASGGATGDLFGSSSSKSTYWFVPGTTGTYYLAVDSDTSGDQGDFTLEIEEITAPTNTKCTAAENITLTLGKASIKGSTVGAKDEFSTLTCGGYIGLQGPQAYYALPAAAGKGYKLTVTPTFSAYLYAFSSAAGCQLAGIETDCASDGMTGDRWGSSSSKATYYFAPTSPGTYILGVDSSSSNSFGSFTLDVEEYDVPPNGTCGSAQNIALAGGHATIAGSTALGTKDEFSTLTCGGSTSFAGPQLYYKVSLSASRTYRVRLSPSFSAYAYIFPDSAGCQQAQIEAACASGGASGHMLAVGYVGMGAMYFKPPADGTYVIAVDSDGAFNSGDFTLAVDELTSPANATCASAQLLAFTSGVAAVEGDTFGAADEFPTLKCGLSSALAGPQVYYKIDLVQSTPYTINLTSTFDAYLVVFSSAASCSAAGIETDCASKGASGHVLEVDSATKNLTFTPATSGTYFIAVDSTASTSGNYGAFQLKVKEPPVMPSFTAPFTWDFETSCQSLYASNDWECGKLGTWTGINCDSTETPPSAAHSGTGLWGTILNGCHTPLGNADSVCNNADPGDDSVLGFKVSLPAGWTKAELSYWAWDDYFIGFDWTEVRINGAAVQQFCSAGSVPEPPVWTQRTIDLSSYAGKTVQVEFHFMATGVINYAGWYIDDVAVTGS